MVFNVITMTDKDRIIQLGGATKVSELLGLGNGGAQRVHNWMTRGIPARIKLDRPDLFPHSPPDPTHPTTQQPADQAA
jgi:hypothetical protein